MFDDTSKGEITAKGWQILRTFLFFDSYPLPYLMRNSYHFGKIPFSYTAFNKLFRLAAGRFSIG